MFNFNKIQYLSRGEFDIFKIDNFISKNIFEKIRSNLPDLKLSDVDKKYIINKKIGLQPFDGLYEKIILSNTVLKELHDEFFNIFFLKKIKNLFKKEIVRSRLNDINYLSKLLIRKDKFLIKNKHKNLLEKILFNHIYPSIQYSFMYNGSKIVPHTDSKSKLISLMLYFPDDNIKYEDRITLGTTFYDSSKKNMNNKHLENPEDEIKFKKESKKILTLPFEGCNLYGFIRTSKSWHTVETIKRDEEFIRKSININLLFD